MVDSKGKWFEDRIASLFELLGARVERGVEICNKKVDLFVTLPLPGLVGQHRLIVECKAEKTARAQNQRVMEFAGLLQIARSSGLAESAEIVTMAPWSEQAKGFAKSAGINLLTLHDKIRGLIDFAPYLQTLTDAVKKGDGDIASSPPLASYYVTPSGRWHHPDDKDPANFVNDLVSTLAEWASSPGQASRIAVLGDYGTGKTSLCRMLAAHMAQRYIADASTLRIPILLRLHDFTHTIRQESLLANFLDEQCGVTNPRYGLFREMRDSGFFLFLLDGFDEMATKADEETLKLNAHELDLLIGDNSSRALLTSRPEYFFSDSELRSTLTPNAGPIPMGSYKLLFLDQWTPEKVSIFFQRRILAAGGSAADIEMGWRRVESLGLSDLANRPVLADMIVRTLPALIKSEEHPRDRSELYGLYLHGELTRQRFARQRGLLLRDNQRLEILQHVAAEMHIDPGFILGLETMRSRLAGTLDLQPDELVAYAREFLTCSFLRRSGNRYFFSHKSIQEYLVAREYAANIRGSQLSFFGRKPLDSAVASFLLELLSQGEKGTDQLMKWISRSAYEAKSGFQFIGGIAATVLVLLDVASLARADLTRSHLASADLRFADLREAVFQNTFLDEVDLRAARIPSNRFVRSSRVTGRFSCYLKAKENLDADDLNRRLQSAALRAQVTFRGIATARHAAGYILGIDFSLEELDEESSGRSEKNHITRISEFTEGVRTLPGILAAWVFEEDRCAAIEKGLVVESGLNESIRMLGEQGRQQLI